MKNNNVFKATLWYTLSSFLLKGIGFITTPIFSRILTTDEYGIINNYIAWLSIISIIATLSLSSSLIRARFEYKEELPAFIKTNLLFGSTVTILTFGIVFLKIDFWADLFVLKKQYIIIMLASIIVSPAYDMFIMVERFRYRYKQVAIISVGLSVANIALSFILIWLMNDNLTARIIGMQLPTIVLGAALYIKLLLGVGKCKIDYIKYSIPICLPYIIHLLSGSLLNNSDRTMITKMCGSSDNALYSMACNVALIPSVFWNAINSAISPWLGEKLNEKEYGDIKEYSYIYITFFAIIVLGIMLIAPEILLVLGPSKYMEAKKAIPPVVSGTLFLALYSLYVNIEQFEKRTIGMAIGTVLCSLLNIILNWLMIPVYGYVAAAYTTLFCYVVLFIIHYFLVRRLNLQKCYDTRFVFAIGVLGVLSSVLASALYNWKSRYFLVLAYFMFVAFFLIKNRQYLNQIINKTDYKR